MYLGSSKKNLKVLYILGNNFLENNSAIVKAGPPLFGGFIIFIIISLVLHHGT